MQSVVSALKNAWFQDPQANDIFINETAVRIRAGILLVVPVYMAFTFIDLVYGQKWIVDANTVTDTFDMDWDGRIIYAAEMTKRTYEYSLQTGILLYMLFEMLAGMFVWSSRLSPTIQVANLLSLGKPPVWKPLVPKRFAWSIGTSFIIACLLFFNPDVFASWVNAVLGEGTLPETYNYMPTWIPMYLVWVCLGFMWLEAILGFCAGCKLHALLVWFGVLKEPCEACNNIDWDAIRARQAAKQ